MKNFFTDNVNSILGAISLHLMVVIIFLWFKLGEMNEIKNEQVLIEFSEEIVPVEEKAPANESSTDEQMAGLQQLDRQTLHTIASNVSSKLEKEISTSEYEKQVMQEIGISSLKSPGAELEKQLNPQPDENAIETSNEPEKAGKDFDVPNIIRKENTTVSYFLEGRWHTYIYIPTYKCQGGGTVILDIVINQSGKVITALIAENKSTTDDCLRQEAYRSAISSQFNADPKASSKQLGTITYVFLPQ